MSRDNHQAHVTGAMEVTDADRDHRPYIRIDLYVNAHATASIRMAADSGTDIDRAIDMACAALAADLKLAARGRPV